MTDRTPSLDEFDGDARRRRPQAETPRRRPASDRTATAERDPERRRPIDRDSERNSDRRTTDRRTPRPVPDSEGPRRPETRRRRPEQPRRRFSIIEFCRRGSTRLAVGIFLCLFAIVMAVCCVSYFFTYAGDQSITHGATLTEMAESPDKVKTLFGAVGVVIARWLLLDSFGIGSFALVVYTFIVGLAVLGVKKIQFFALTFRCLFTAVALSVIFGFYAFNASTDLPLGGNHGHYINELVMKYSDVLGGFALSLMVIALLAAVYYKPMKTVFAFVKSIIPKPKPKPAPPVEEPAQEQPASPLDALESDEPADAEVPAVEEEHTESSEEASTDPSDHSRFMPPVTIDDFDGSSESPEPSDNSELSEHSEHSEISQPSESSESSELSPESPESPDSAQSAAIPMQIVVSPTPVAEPGQPERKPDPIQHGDHIGLDRPFDVRASHSHYQFPPLDLLIDHPKTFEIDEAEQEANKELIVNTLLSYNVEIEHIIATIGPTVTLYEIVPVQGTRIAKIRSLEDEIAMSLAAYGIRIIAPIPGKRSIGLEVPNRKPQIVSMRPILESEQFRNTKMRLPMALGSTIDNKDFMVDLAKMPHLLVAGATGQGKSVGLNCIITSLLYSKHPDELKFVLVDPKMVEFSLYSAIDRQYLAKIPDGDSAVITDADKALDTLNSLCVEMDNRYELLRLAGVRGIEDYNARFCARTLNPELGHRYLPYIVIIVDEYADLVMTASKDIAAPICRIAQKARAVGLHMIIATQRPSTDIITGKIKANFPARIAFKVTQGVDSKTILDRPGAQRLIGRGDMLVMNNGTIERVQCAYVDTPEVEAICSHIGAQPGFDSCYLLPDPPTDEPVESGAAADFAITDEFRRCAMYIATQDQASITMLQRKFEIGFNKAGRFMDQMQQLGIVGPANGAKPRQVLMGPDEAERILN